MEEGDDDDEDDDGLAHDPVERGEPDAVELSSLVML